MSVETLRKAASLMRERAEKATSAPWDWGNCEPQTQAESRVLGMYSLVYGDGEDERSVALIPGSRRVREVNAEHIASWHPAVGLAVADWLDRKAERAEDMWLGHGKQMRGPEWHDALAVATAYLGEQS